MGLLYIYGLHMYERKWEEEIKYRRTGLSSRLH